MLPIDAASVAARLRMRRLIEAEAEIDSRSTAPEDARRQPWRSRDGSIALGLKSNLTLKASMPRPPCRYGLARSKSQRRFGHDVALG